ncbi:MAG: MBL fold metallo-hydrolase [Cellulomonadaceae bacterium]|jgi:ribonuclease BN (tRNA processing enzyme)|nr:MBL fold metallo-hydrolase [Cellulomonadaceae bacterium]
MLLRTLGITGSGPGPDSPASTYLVQVGPEEIRAAKAAGTVPESVEERQWNLVLDLGNGGFAAIQRHINPFDIDAVALTHLHQDHCADLSGLYVYLKYHPERGSAATGTTVQLPVYGPTAVSERVEEMCGISDGASLGSVYQFWPTRNSTPFNVNLGPIHIQPFHMNHTVETFGLRITAPSALRPGEIATLAYSGDTDYCHGAVNLARDADVFLCEAAFVEGRDDGMTGVHLTGKRAGRVAAEAQAKSLLLTHIPVWNDPAVTLAEASETYTGPTALAVPDGEYQI